MELSNRELQRIKVIENAVAGRVTVKQASQLLNLSERQIKRLKRRCQPEQVDWVRHGNRGKEKPWGLGERVQQRILELVRGKYAGFNDSHLREKLVEVEHLTLSRKTVRRVLRRAKNRLSAEAASPGAPQVLFCGNGSQGRRNHYRKPSAILIAQGFQLS